MTGWADTTKATKVLGNRRMAGFISVLFGRALAGDTKRQSSAIADANLNRVGPDFASVSVAELLESL